jgi:hypothetical protein
VRLPRLLPRTPVECCIPEAKRRQSFIMVSTSCLARSIQDFDSTDPCCNERRLIALILSEVDGFVQMYECRTLSVLICPYLARMPWRSGIGVISKRTARQAGRSLRSAWNCGALPRNWRSWRNRSGAGAWAAKNSGTNVVWCRCHATFDPNVAHAKVADAAKEGVNDNVSFVLTVASASIDFEQFCGSQGSRRVSQC